MQGNVPENHDFSDDRGQQFMRLYVGIQRRLYGFVLSLVPNFSDADDIIQETVSVMWSRFDEFEPGTNFSAWALCIARYQVLTHRKRIKRRKMRFSEQAVEAIAEVAESSGEQDKEYRAALKRCLGKLTENERKILHFRYEIGATLRTVAERVDMNINTLYSLLSRLHIALLNCIRKDMSYEGAKQQ